MPQEALERALELVSPSFRAALEKAAAQIRAFHEREVEQSWFTTRADGTMLGVKVTPMAAAGVYVPGGRAQYPSTVLMNIIPAKVAGVERIVMVTPPQNDPQMSETGGISPQTLAAARIAGVDEIYTVGGAQAIAALAYGTESIEKVDVITGPGNAYVAAAKQLVSGDVGIDMVAGPSEVCVLADATAEPAVVAADSWLRQSTIRLPPAISSPATPLLRQRSSVPSSSSWRRALARRSRALRSTTRGPSSSPRT